MGYKKNQRNLNLQIANLKNRNKTKSLEKNVRKNLQIKILLNNWELLKNWNGKNALKKNLVNNKKL